jgi:parallel beta-helix repeat protein
MSAVLQIRWMVLMVFFACGEVHGVEPQPGQADFFIATNGSDDSPGSKEKPFATLSRARSAVRDLLASGVDRDILVLIHGGTYHLKETIVFTRADGSPGGRSITYAAAPGEQPVFSAGVAVTDWREEGNGLWSAPLPEGLDNIKSLYDGDKRLTRARGPGFKPTTKGKGWHNEDQHALHYPEGLVDAWPNLTDSELLIIPAAPWSMNILPLASVDKGNRIAKVASRGTYALDQPTFGKYNATAWIENRREFIDEPGEWAVDTKEKRIHLRPQGGRPGPNILAPGLIEMVRIEGQINYDGPQDQPVLGLVLKGLTFTHADRYTRLNDRVGWGLQHDWEMFDQPTAMVRLRGAESCRIEDCTFSNGAATGLRLDLHCRKNQVVGNTFSHLGGVGILLAGYGPGTKDVNNDNSILHNHIHHIGRDYWHSPAIFVWQSGGNKIANNLIHNTGYSGIVVSGRISFDPSGVQECSRTVRINEISRVAGSRALAGSWEQRERFLHGRRNLIGRNEIRQVMEIMSDGNGIYISGAGTGNRVMENFIHNCTSEHFGEGIRCDDDQYETTIERNILWRLGGLATYVTIKGRNHVIDNIFAEPLNPPQRGLLSLEFIKGQKIDGTRIARNIFYSTRMHDKMVFQGANYYGTEIFLRDADADRNIYWNTADPLWGKNHLAAEQKHRSERSSIAADPMFKDPANGDFSLHPKSPVRALGFKPIDMSLIGIGKSDSSNP